MLTYPALFASWFKRRFFKFLHYESMGAYHYDLKDSKTPVEDSQDLFSVPLDVPIY